MIWLFGENSIPGLLAERIALIQIYTELTLVFIYFWHAGKSVTIYPG